MFLNNPFVRAVGIVAIVWALLQGLSYVLDALVKLVTTAAIFTRAYFIPYSTQVAIGLGVVYLIYTAITTSRDD
jgi:DMSO/TMAO reductase YedYZ heme-binding membrane subunit